MARKGRPRKNGKREPNGRVVRKTPADRDIIPERIIAMRVRAGIPRDKARQCGTLEDALYESRLIDFDQLQAARSYIMLRAKNFIAQDNPHVPRDPRAPSGNGPDAYIAFCENAEERYEAVRRSVLAYQREKRKVHMNLINALDCLSDPFGQYVPPDGLEDLQEALIAVHEHLNPRRKSAA